MQLDLAGKVAVVSGASRGIGREIARVLSREGMDIALVARDKALLEEAKAEVEKNGRKAIVLIYDLRDRAAPPACIGDTLRAFGKIDLLVNVAGDTRGGNFLDLTDDDWANGFELKTFGYIRMTRAAWPHLKKTKGSIVNIIGGNARQGHALYTIGGAVNAALVNFTKSMADLGNIDGVRVNAINPGVLVTRRLENRIELVSKQTGVSREEAKKNILEQMRVPRFGETVEIADLVAYLTSQRADFLQGAIIDMDGGFNRAV
jgi:NAD(P)-dependent dehydrogenase (short-subunit alcohol dehydrogenase family)